MSVFDTFTRANCLEGFDLSIATNLQLQGNSNFQGTTRMLEGKDLKNSWENEELRQQQRAEEQFSWK